MEARFPVRTPAPADGSDVKLLGSGFGRVVLETGVHEALWTIDRVLEKPT